MILALGKQRLCEFQDSYIVSNKTIGKTSLYVEVKHLAVRVVQRIYRVVQRIYWQAAGKEEDWRGNG